MTMSATPRPVVADYPRPMLLMDAQRPYPQTPADWIAEIKWNGMRAVLTDGRIISRHGRDWSTNFPELLDTVAMLTGHGTVLDGEVVLGDQSDRDLTQLQRRLRMRQPFKINGHVQTHPATLIVFDVLHWGANDQTSRPWWRRRGLLEDAVGEGVGRARVGPVWDGEDAPSAWQQAEDHDLEGIVFKRRTSLYLPGERTPHWLRRKRWDTPDYRRDG